MNDNDSVLGLSLRHFTTRLRRSRGWTQERIAEELTAAGYPIKTFNYRNRENRAAPVGIDEAVALATLFGFPGLDAFIETSKSPCERCQGSPPSGFACTLCGAAS